MCTVIKTEVLFFGAVSTTNQIPLSLMKLGWDTANISTLSSHATATHCQIALMLRADKCLRALFFQVLPKHLRDSEHESIVEDDTQGTGQEVRTKLARQRSEQKESRALLLLQLPEKLSLVWQSAAQCHTRCQGLLLPARGIKHTQLKARHLCQRCPNIVLAPVKSLMYNRQ